MIKKLKLLFQTGIPYISTLIYFWYYYENQNFDAFISSYNNIKIWNIITFIFLGFLLVEYIKNASIVKKKFSIIISICHVIVFTLFIILPYTALIKGQLFYFLIESYQFFALWIGINLTILVVPFIELYLGKNLKNISNKH